jgi:NAD(P)H-dependent FMN reductase
MIEIIAGTNRPDSNSSKIAALLLSWYRAEGTEAQVLDLRDLPADLFVPASFAQKPASFEPIQRRILDAAGLHIVTPEYNGTFPGVLKWFIDLLKFPESFEHRAVAFTGVAMGAWGALRSIEQLQQIFAYRNAYILPERVFLSAIHEKLDAKGQLTDAAIAERLREQTRQFAAFVRRVRG